MTCIVGLIDDGEVYMGSDSAGVQGWDLRLRSDNKVFQIKDMLIGFTTSFRMGQILRFALPLNLAPYPYSGYSQDEVERYMYLDFLENVRELFKIKGYSKIENNNEAGGEFLVGFQGQLWSVYEDFQIAQFDIPFQAIGCGASFAMGALSVIWEEGKCWPIEPKQMIQMALCTAEKFSAGVRGPFNVLKLEVDRDSG